MAIKTVLFLMAFVTVCGGALFNPLLGVLGYISEYSVGHQWYTAPVRQWGVRISFLLAIFTGVGIMLNHRKLRYGRSILVGHEKLMLLFLGMVWLSVLTGERTQAWSPAGLDHASVKVTKVVIFLFMLTHVVTTAKRVDIMLWCLVLTALVLGHQAYTTPSEQFTQGRLEGIGGPDFRDANAFAAYLAAVLPIVGVQFLRSGWLGRSVCLISGAFAVNAIVLTRSRGAMVGIAAGALIAGVLAPRRHRAKIFLGILVAAIAGYSLTDLAFWTRAETITVQSEERDRSAQSRVEIWRGSLSMLADNPLGVGAGNFEQAIGRYAPKNPRRDAHNTFVRCYGELGIPGIAVFVALVVNAGIVIRRTMRSAKQLPRLERASMELACYGLVVGLGTILACGITATLLYVEALWWFLAIPVCFERAVENALVDLAPEQAMAQVAGEGLPESNVENSSGN